MEDAYAAGLFDGEGYVRVNVWHKPNSTHTRYQVFVGLGVTHLPVIQQLQEQYGGGINENRHDLRNPKNRIQFTWNVVSRNANDFLKRIFPYLVIKQDQVALALKLQESIDLYKGQLGNQYRFHPDRDRIFAERAAMAEEIHRLKKVAFASLSIVAPVSSVNGH